MTRLDDLVAVASVGTSRKAPSLQRGGGPLGEAVGAIESLPQASAEAKLLGAAVVRAQYEACGRLPRDSAAPTGAAEEETLRPCSRRAGEVLGEFLAMPNNFTKDRLVGEWLGLACGGGIRAPWRLLPALLDYGAGHRAHRETVGRAAGTRGAWLARQNPHWREAASGQEDPEQLWSTGTRDQRVAALARLRSSDPSKGREWVASAWKQDAVEDRSAFVAALATGLSSADEQFLESARDDRSKQVRAAAADLLARLPDSAFVRRMTGRAQALVKLVPASQGGLLRKGSPARIEIALPPEPLDPSWQRDGIVDKPEGRMGRRQWWLIQAIGFIPPAHWSRSWGLSPEQCIDAAAGEFADVLLEGWHAAAGRNPEPQWVAALLRAAAKDARGPLTLGLLAHLPPESREQVTVELIESPHTSFEQVAAVLREVPLALGPKSAEALFGRIEAEIARQNAGYHFAAAQVLQEAACRVPPAAYEPLCARWSGEAWEQNRKRRDEFLRTLLLRRDMHREITKSD